MQSQAFAAGNIVPWVALGCGVIATQSIIEPMYGAIGLDALRGGLSANDALAAVRGVDLHPERRQVAIVDRFGRFAVHTGAGCIAEAGDARGNNCIAIANMVASSAVWENMVSTFEATTGSFADRLMLALIAAQTAGGDMRGKRSAALRVVSIDRNDYPWRDIQVDLRVDSHNDPIGELNRLLAYSTRHGELRHAYRLALDGETAEALREVEGLEFPDPETDPDLCIWLAVVLAAGGRLAEATEIVAATYLAAPRFVELLRRYRNAGLLDGAAVPESVFPPHVLD